MARPHSPPPEHLRGCQHHLSLGSGWVVTGHFLDLQIHTGFFCKVGKVYNECKMYKYEISRFKIVILKKRPNAQGLGEMAPDSRGVYKLLPYRRLSPPPPPLIQSLKSRHPWKKSCNRPWYCTLMHEKVKCWMEK